MGTFKIGDKVRLKDNGSWSPYYWDKYGKGKQLTVYNVSENLKEVYIKESEKEFDRARLPFDDIEIYEVKQSDYHSAKHDKDKLRFDLVPELYDRIVGKNFHAHIESNIAVNPNCESKFEMVISIATLALGGYINLRRELARIFTYGCTKYGEESWKTIPDGLKRYKSACLRHLDEFYRGNYINEDDGGMLHIAQAAWNALAVLWLEENNKTKE